MLAGLGIATAWASNYIGTLQGIIGGMGNVILFTFAVLFGAVVIRSYRLKTHPVFGIVGLLGIPVAVIVTGYISNIAALFTQFEFLGEALNQFQYVLLFIQNSPTIVAIGSVIVLLVMMGGGILARQ